MNISNILDNKNDINNGNNNIIVMEVVISVIIIVINIIVVIILIITGTQWKTLVDHCLLHLCGRC